MFSVMLKLLQYIPYLLRAIQNITDLAINRSLQNTVQSNSLENISYSKPVRKLSGIIAVLIFIHSGIHAREIIQEISRSVDGPQFRCGTDYNIHKYTSSRMFE